MTSVAFTRENQRAGFSLVEALIVIALTALILGALGTITAQWIPNWNHGVARVQRAERLAAGIERIVADLSAAELVVNDAPTKSVHFDGRELSVTFVRSAVGPNSRSGLEILRYREASDERGPAIVRESGPLRPGGAGAAARLPDAVVVLRGPYRIGFAYAGLDGVWQPNWSNRDQLPSAVRLTVRDTVTQSTLVLSSAATIHVDAAGECVRATDMKQCLARTAAEREEADAEERRSPEPGSQQDD